MKSSIVILGLCLMVLLLSMRPFGLSHTPPAQQTQAYLMGQLTALGQALMELEGQLQRQDAEGSRTAYQAVRTHFKRAEGLVAYLDPQLYERTLNESPLLKPTPAVANKEIHYPRGLQVLDETLYEEAVDWGTATELTQELRRQLQGLQARLATTPLHDALVIHAIKEELLRSFTLGITGYDTPGSGQAIQDLKAVLEGIRTVLGYYEGYFEAEQLAVLNQHLHAVAYEDFGAFDRYGYLVEHLMPMLEALEAIRVEAGLEAKEELEPAPSPVNSSFTSPFQKDLLRPSYYANLPEAEVTDARIALGKALFNDPLLSQTLHTSCGTCHREADAFTDLLPRSQNGDGSATTQRNAPSLNYSIYASAYFHDLRAHDLKNQFEHVIVSPEEFDTDYATILRKLQDNKNYTTAFQACYADYPQPINPASFHHALKCYLISLPKFDSPFDRWVQQKATNIPTEVRQGFNLFMGKAQCGTCHFPPTFSGLVPPAYTDTESEILGVLVDENYDAPVLDKDRGRQANGIVKDNFAFFERSFKTVSIRNSAQTAPYMHNGSIQSLEQVVEFYDRGGGAGMGLEVAHQTLPDTPLELTEAEKAALVAFMKSLSDVED